jgi:undecaprenyl-diphosphatase
MLAWRSMSPFQAGVLGVIQGLTEFLPISSSAHLYVVPTLLGWPYAGVAFDVALHWGTLLALVAGFRRDWWMLFREALVGAPVPRATARATLLKIAVASVPAAVVGLLLEKKAEPLLRHLPLQASMLVIFGFLLWWVDRAHPAGQASDIRPLEVPGWRACLGVGLAQALALVPGVSRSGITITAGRALGVSRVGAARLSFLLATPITLGAGVLEFHNLSHDLAWPPIALGIAAAAVTGFLAIHGLLRWLNRAGFGGFFAYRVALAFALIVFMMLH